MKDLPMRRLGLELAIACSAAAVLASQVSIAKVLPPARKSAQVEIRQQPALEFASDQLVFVRWVTTNPGGTDDHFAIIQYGTNPKDLGQTARSHIRINPRHRETTFRVRVDGLKPQTTYYYKVTSTGTDGTSDGVESAIQSFTTPAPGERVTFPVPTTSAGR